MRAVDKFCLTHRRFGIQRLMLYIVFGSAAVYLVGSMVPALYAYVTFNPSAILRGEVWRLVTWVFSAAAGNALMPGSIIFTALLLYFYYFIGQTLEREWGTPKFTIYYIFGVVLNIIYGFVAWLIVGRPAFGISIDASFLNLSMFFAFAVLFPEQRVMLFFIIPIKVKWLGLIDAVYFLYQIVAALVYGNYLYALLPIVAILNFILFCGDDLIHLLRPYKARSSRQAINFRKAARQKRHEDAKRPYRHKCSVCGKTDTEYPSIEFRYCSRCNGYHCFCADHINSHIHFQ